MNCLSSAVFAVFSGPPAETAGKSGFPDLDLVSCRLHVIVNPGTMHRVASTKGQCRRLLLSVENRSSSSRRRRRHQRGFHELWIAAHAGLSRPRLSRNQPEICIRLWVPPKDPSTLFPEANAQHSQKFLLPLDALANGTEPSVTQLDNADEISQCGRQRSRRYLRLTRDTPEDPPTKISSGADDRRMTKTRPDFVVFS